MISIIKSNLPVILVIMPLFLAFILPTISRRLRLVEGLVVSLESIWFLGALYLASLVLLERGSPIIYNMGGWPAPWGIEIRADNLAALFLLVVTAVSLPIALFSKNNLDRELGEKKKIASFYVLLLLLSGALAGMALTNDLFNVFVLVEVATLSSCGLVSSSKDPASFEAAFKYLILATLGSTFVLGGIGFIYILTGHLNMSLAHGELMQVWKTSPRLVWTAMSFIFLGFGVKSALFPLHIWLPDAHSKASSPASAILSSLAVKGYIICLLKIIYRVFGQELLIEFHMDRIILLIAMIAMIAASLLALSQKELKRRLAYSTVAQVGYIYLGLGFMNELGIKGSLFYLVSHGLIKASLFLSAGSMIGATGKEEISDLAGIGRKMPLTMGVFTIASLGLIGIPLFSGFVGKWYLVLGGLEAGNYLSLFSIILASLLCAAYLLPIIRIAYFEAGSKEDIRDPGLAQKTALLLLAMAILVLGIIPGPVLELAGRAATELLSIH